MPAGGAPGRRGPDPGDSGRRKWPVGCRQAGCGSSVSWGIGSATPPRNRSRARQVRLRRLRAVMPWVRRYTGVTRPAFRGGADSVTTSYSGDWIANRPRLSSALPWTTMLLPDRRLRARKPWPNHCRSMAPVSSRSVPSTNCNLRWPTLAERISSSLPSRVKIPPA